MLDATQIASLDFGQGNACTTEEYAFLGALVQLTAPRTIVEIGTSTGIGTLAMAAALADAGPASAPRVITIDLPLGRSTFAAGLARNRAAVERLIPAVAALVDYRVGDSHTVLDALVAAGVQADLVFIDGGHSEAVVRGDWERALALKPRVVVLHDTVHLTDVARVVDAVAARYPGVTITYPRRRLPGAAPSPAEAPAGASHGPGFTIFSDLEQVRRARTEAAGPVHPAAHEVASTLLHDRVVTPLQARTVAPRAAAEPPPLRELEIVLSGRNDDYGGEDFHERMLTVAAFNHARLTEAGVPHRFTLVEWNPPEGRPPLIDRLRERLPWWHRSWVVSRAWQTWYQENPRLQFMEFFAKNAGIRRAAGDWILTTNSDVFLGREIVQRLAAGRLVPGTLYRASRLDLDRHMPRDGVTWARLEDPRHLLRRFDPDPPYMNEAAGDFLLLDRESYHRVGGFNERVRFSKIHKDGQFCIQAYHHGLAIEWLGPVYHIDHDGSFINTKHTYKPGYADAPFGPDWMCWTPFWNRDDWGVRNAIEEPRGGTTWLRSPEEAGPVLSLLLHGRGDAAARAAAIGSLLAGRASLEIVVVDPEPELIDALAAHRDDARLRLLGAPDVPPGTPAGTAMRIAGACAHGRHVAWLPGPIVCDGLDRLVDRLAEASAEGDGPIVHAVAAGPDASARPLTIASRRAVDRLDGVDALAADVVGEFAARARKAYGATVVDGVSARVLPAVDGALHDLSIDRAWSALGDGAVLPAVVAADLLRRSELLTEHLRVRLSRELPLQAREVAIYGVGPITPYAIAAVRALGRRITGVFVPDGDRSGACEGVAVRPAKELKGADDVWVVATCTSPSEVSELFKLTPVSRTVHVVEPVSLRPDAARFAGSADFDYLGYARDLRKLGAWRQAEAAYIAALRDPTFDGDVVRPRYELALVQEQLGKTREVEKGLRYALRHFAEERSLVAYNLGSFYERHERWPEAVRAFTRSLRCAAPDDAARRGGCYFHLGQIARVQDDLDTAREHFARCLDVLPDHGKARAELDWLNASQLPG